MVSLDSALDAAMQRYYATLQGSMIKAVVGGNIEGQIIAARQLGITLGYQDMTPQAIEYATEYARLLQTEGGTMINGEFVPWFQKYQDSLREKFTDIIQKGLDEGLSKEELGSQIADLLQETQRHGELIAQHEVRQVQVQACKRQLQDFGIEQVIVVGYDIPDGTVCDECQEYLDHGAYDINEAPFLPAHPNCRHNIAPFIPGIDESSTESDLSVDNPYFSEDYRTALEMQYSTIGEH